MEDAWPEIHCLKCVTVAKWKDIWTIQSSGVRKGKKKILVLLLEDSLRNWPD